MRKTKLFILFLVMCISIVSVAAVTYGWFVSVKRTGSVYFKTGEVKYVMTNDSFNNNFIKKSYIVPGEELLTSDIYVINQSTISSNLRIKVIVEVNGTEYTVDNINQYIIVDFTEDWEYELVEISESKGENKYWYFNANNSQIIASTSSSVNINIVESLKLNGATFGNSVASKDVIITIYFQGKQSNYATWEDLGSITKKLES